MNNLKKIFIWYFMFTKRLLHKLSFWLLLFMIPVVMLTANNVMSQEKGVLRILLCNTDGNITVQNIIDTLTKKDSIVLYSQCDSRDYAIEKVKNHEVDVAWVFAEDFEEKIYKFASKKNSEALVEVVEREENVPAQLSREVLYGAVYKDLSYSIFKSFVYEKFISDDEDYDEALKAIYYGTERNRDIIQVCRLNSGEVVDANNDYLKSPLRGLFALVMVLCALASAMYFLKDQQAGKYDWIPVNKRVIPAFASCLSATILSSVAVTTALLISDISVNVVHELLSMLIYIISVTGFSLIMCIAFQSPVKLGASIPGIIVVMLLFSPVFFDVEVLKPIRMLIPSYYYLYSVFDISYCFYGIVYSVAIYVVAFLLNSVLCRLRSK